VDLERTAQIFDVMYSEMTVLQRRLITAVPAGEDDRSVTGIVRS
jgi:hypothetical protein